MLAGMELITAFIKVLPVFLQNLFLFRRAFPHCHNSCSRYQSRHSKKISPICVACTYFQTASALQTPGSSKCLFLVFRRSSLLLFCPHLHFLQMLKEHPSVCHQIFYHRKFLQWHQFDRILMIFQLLFAG